MNTTTRQLLLWCIVAAGLFVPILPRIMVPIVKPGRYLDTADMFWPPSWGTVVIFLLAVFPFAVLAWFSRSYLSSANLSSAERSARIAGIITAFISAFGLGFRSHVPQTSPGVNMWVFFFPFLAAVAMPVGYVLGYAFWRMNTLLMSKRE